MKNLLSTKGVSGFRKALRRQPLDEIPGGVLLQTAKTLRHQGRTEETRVFIRAVLQQRRAIPKSTVILLYHLRAECSLDTGKWSAAAADYSRILDIVSDPVAWANRALARRELKDYHRALADYSTAVELAPRDAAALRGKGEVLNLIGRHADAVAPLEASTRLDPKSSRAFESLGIAYYNARQWREAYRVLRKAVQLNPGSRLARLGIQKIEKHFDL